MSDDNDGTLSWQQVQSDVRDRLDSAGIDGADLEARRLIESATGVDGAEYIFVLEELATTKRLANLDALLIRRLAGEPLQYVLGAWGFRTLDLAVDQRVLIPRAETETLVEIALGELKRSENTTPMALDLGTGSGAIGLSLAAENSSVSVWLSDSSADALEVARGNLAGLGTLAAPRVRIVEGSWFEALPSELRGKFDLIASNPPYVTTTDPLPESVKDWEPAGALFSGSDGLDDIRVIVAGAPSWLRPGGCLVVELAPAQAAIACELAHSAGFADAEVRSDQYSQPRVLVARL